MAFSLRPGKQADDSRQPLSRQQSVSSQPSRNHSLVEQMSQQQTSSSSSKRGDDYADDHNNNEEDNNDAASIASGIGSDDRDGTKSDSKMTSDKDDVGLQSAVQSRSLPEVAVGDEIALVRAAQRGEWNVVENELKRYKKNDKRINVADPLTGETTLMLACQHSRYLLVSRLCDMGASLNIRSEDRRTALHYAAAEGHEEIVKILIGKRADPNLFGGKNSQLPLHIAATRSVGALIAAQALLRSGLRESRLLKDGLGNLPITYAVDSGCYVLVKEMLQYFAKEQVNWHHDQTGDYLVHIAGRKKNTEIMNALCVEGDADVNVQNNDGQTPLHICARSGDEGMVKLLQTFRANANVIDKKERTPLHVAAEHGHTTIVEILVERYKANVHLRTKDGSTLMHLAADKGYADTVLAFIKRGVPLHMPNKSGTLCLHAAAQNGHVQVVKTLIQKGQLVDGRTKDGYTALHLAVLNSQPDIIQTLLGFGAKVDLKGGAAREAPLHIAARMPEGYYCAEMLIKSGAIVNNCTEETLETPLHISARNGFLELLKMLLEEGADPMRLNRAGESALHIAVRHCHYEIAKAIIAFVNNNSSGRDATNLVNLANNEGESTFHLAAELGKSQAHEPFEEVDIIRLLLENGADPLGVTKLTNETSLHYCARSGNPDIFHEIVRHLGHAFQIACNRQDRMGWSALMTSCEQGHASVAEILLANSARADVFDEHGKAALHLAAENGHIACCEILLNYKAFVNAKSKLGITPLHFAAQNGYAELVKLLIEKYHAAANALSLDKKTPLHLAAEAGRKEVCQLLLSLHSDPNAVDALGQTPLHLAAENDHSDVVKLFMKYKPELVTAASKSGMTCAHIAANKGSVAVIKELMQFNKSLVTTVKNKVNESLPLHLAVECGHKDVVRVLIDAGSSATAENSEGMTAIHLAAKEGNIEVLQAIPSKVSLRALSQKNGLSPIHIAAFYGKSDIVRELQARVDINIKTELPQLAAAVSDPQLKALVSTDNGLTPLHLASFMGHENVVRLILNNSNVQTEEVTNLLSRVPLHYACQNGHLVVVSLLMSRSANHLRSRDKRGRMPLHLAAENGHVDMVSMLLGQGAEINVGDQDGWTSLHYATRNGFLNVVKLLIETGASPISKTVDGKIALVLSASGGHIDVLNYLLKKEHDSDELMEDKTFLLDLMLCGKTNENDSINEFVMHSKAPLYTAARLTKLYRELATKEKERAKDLNDAGRHCEHMATELLGIASTIAPPSAILRATDSKGNQFLDILLENNMKGVIEHAAVQRYLSDIWVGSLSSWATWRLVLLFVGFFICPPLCAYFCLPFKHHRYHHIPVIKFLAMIVSHLYLIGFLSIIAAIPIDPIIWREHFLPDWYEIMFLAWVSGLLVAELTRAGVTSGLGLLRHVIIFFSTIGSLFQIAAIAVDYGVPDGRDTALILMYLRNFMLSFALFAAIILILDFFLIHHLFGPFGIIISSVLRDLMTFIVVLLLFVIGFSFQICCLFSPLKLEGSEFDTTTPGHGASAATKGGHQSGRITPEHGTSHSDKVEPLLENEHLPIQADDDHNALSGNSFKMHAEYVLPIVATTLGTLAALALANLTSKISNNASQQDQNYSSNKTIANFTSILATLSTPSKVATEKLSNLTELRGNSSNDTISETGPSNRTTSRRIKRASSPSNHDNDHGQSKDGHSQKEQPSESHATDEHGSNSHSSASTKTNDHHSEPASNGHSDPHSNQKGKNCPARHTTKIVKAVKTPPKEAEQHAEYDIISNRYPSTLINLFATLYFAMFAMGKPDVLPRVENGPEWSQILFEIWFGVWMITAVIVLIPLLIAMLTETYKRIHQRADSEWKFGRAKLIRNMIKLSAAPTPLNLIVRPYLYMKSLKKHGKMMCTIYASYFAAEDEHQGADEMMEVHGEGHAHHARQQMTQESKPLVPGGTETENATAPRHSGRHHGLERIEHVLEWSIVVRRYRASRGPGDAHVGTNIAEGEGVRDEAGDESGDDLSEGEEENKI